MGDRSGPGVTPSFRATFRARVPSASILSLTSPIHFQHFPTSPSRPILVSQPLSNSHASLLGLPQPPTGPMPLQSRPFSTAGSAGPGQPGRRCPQPLLGQRRASGCFQHQGQRQTPVPCALGLGQRPVPPVPAWSPPASAQFPQLPAWCPHPWLDSTGLPSAFSTAGSV